MTLGTHPDTGAIDRSTTDRWDNSSCVMGITMTGTHTQTATLVDPTFACTMTGTHTQRATLQVPYININALFNTLIDRAEVHRAIGQPYWTATFHFQKGTTGGFTSSAFFNATPIAFFMPDYTGKINVPFVGFTPSETRNHNSWESDETFTAYSFAWYLSHQYLPDLPNKRLTINSLVCMVYDPRTYDMSKNNVMYPDVYVAGLLGCNLNCHGSGTPALEGEWFVDDTGKDYWKRVTNLNPSPHIVTPVTHTGYIPPPWVHQDFSTTTTKQQAQDRLNQYYRYVSYDKWSYDSSELKFQPYYYWVPFVDVDGGAGAGLGLPTKANLTVNSTNASDLWNFLDGKIAVDQKGDEKFNAITVRCASLSSSGWYQSVHFEASVFHPVYNPSASGPPYELPVEYYEENPDICTQTDCDQRRDDLVAYYTAQVLSYRCTFKMRSDLELWQLIAVSGFNTSTYGEIPDGDYRIIDIKYILDASLDGIDNEVEVVLMKSSIFNAAQNLKRTLEDSIRSIQNIVKDMQAPKEQKIEGSLLYATTGPAAAPVIVTLNNATPSVQITKKAFYPGAATLAAGTKVMLSVASNGIVIMTPV